MIGADRFAVGVAAGKASIAELSAGLNPMISSDGADSIGAEFSGPEFSEADTSESATTSTTDDVVASNSIGVSAVSERQVGSEGGFGDSTGAAFDSSLVGNVSSEAWGRSDSTAAATSPGRVGFCHPSGDAGGLVSGPAATSLSASL